MSRSRAPLCWLWLALLCAGATGAASAPGVAWAQTPAAQPPAIPADPPTPPPADPSVVHFETEVGLLLVPVKATATADYEAMIRALQAALAASADPDRRRQAAGWRVFKAAETDAKGQALYVHLLSPALADVDYRPSAVLDDLLDGAPEELLVKYREAHAGPPSRISLAEIANMTLAPAPLPPAPKPLPCL